MFFKQRKLFRPFLRPLLKGMFQLSQLSFNELVGIFGKLHNNLSLASYISKNSKHFMDHSFSQIQIIYNSLHISGVLLQWNEEGIMKEYLHKLFSLDFCQAKYTN